ncbi:L,D-transpeptidase [Corynebacterium sp. UBA2622]|uniref:L,D-transpeptidase n=1 Tax=Corynebacterium sp. UBA2622 TaxID=1946393 RepID=UPI0025BC9728|nr:Ig-like domain-containing protein [Corynebacterium sp. UBA2622]
MKSRGLRQSMAAVAVFAAGMTLAACTVGGSESGSAHGSSSATSEAFDPPTVSVEDGETGVGPNDPVKVTAPAGLESLELTNDAGKSVEGTFNADRTEWVLAEPLGYGRTYSFEGSDKAGNKIESAFTTVYPDAQTNAYLGPVDGAQVGVGQAVNIRFSTPPQDQKAVEKAITVTTSNNTEGAFYWLDPYELRWRPKDYWQPGTSVTVKAALYGKNLGGGVYGAQDVETSFTIGDAVVSKVDNATKTLTVYRNGEVVNSFPVSLGKDGQFDTPNGVYVVGDRNETLRMDSRTYGLSLDAGGYVTDVKNATQLSYSGIYVHSAPWALWALGSVNQSHGCINASPADAAWFLQNSTIGDPVEVVNTYGGTMSGIDGLGYWNIPWSEWEGATGGQ